MSASVVRQLETEMRMRRWPCQVVDPIQHSPERCTASMTRSVVASSPNRTSTWFRTTLIDHQDAIDVGELSSKTLGQAAAAVDEFGNAAASELAQRGPRREPPRPS